MDIGIKQMLTKIINQFKVLGELGSIYITTSEDNPSTVFGGSWTKIQDKFLIGASSTYPVNSTGGTPNGIIQSHSHQYMVNTTSAGSGGSYSCYTKKSKRKLTTRYTSSTGSQSLTNSNIPQYYAVHIWKRADGSGTLTYNPNQGVLGNVPSAVELTDSTDTYITSYKPTRSGYSFLGWAFGAEAQTPQYTTGQLFKAAGAASQDITLYAVWHSDIFLAQAVTKNAIGETSISTEGGNVSGPTSATYGSTITVTASPNVGYVFQGWTTNPDSTTYVSTNLSYSFTAGQIDQLYGIFEKTTQHFYINNVSYALEPGCTWAEWLESIYNTSDGDYVSRGGFVISIHSLAAGYDKFIYPTTVNTEMPNEALYPSETLTPGGGKILPSATILANSRYYSGQYIGKPASETENYTINVAIAGSTVSTVQGAGQYTEGALVTVKVIIPGAVSDTLKVSDTLYLSPETKNFVGWYTNNAGTGTALSYDSEYTFVAEENKNIYAVFK